MSRLRQLRAYEYGSSSAIQTEFESIVRYLQSAEVGGQTLSETINKITDDNGNLQSNVELRNDATNGIQYRVGEYTDAEAGWTTIISAADLRGPSGVAVGEIGAPIFNSRVDYTVVTTLSDPVDNTEILAGGTVFNYSHLESDELLVYKNGILLTPTVDYTSDHNGNSGTGTVTLTSAFATADPTITTDNFTIYKVRSTAITNFRRLDATNDTGADLSFVSFDLSDSTQILVYVSGILYREPDDYARDPINDRVVFTANQYIPQGANYSIITVEDADVQTVTGIMMESAYTDITTGLIQFNKLGISDGAITQPKVQNLQTDLAARAKLFTTTPSAADLASGIVDDAFYKRTVNNATEVVYYDGTSSIVLNPSTSLPTASDTDVNKVVTVDSAGSYVLSLVDLSGVVENTDKNAANGVAALDDNAKIVKDQYAMSGDNSLLSRFSGSPHIEFFYDPQQGSDPPTSAIIQLGDYRVERFYGQNFKITGLEIRCSGGSGNIRLKKSGAVVGDTHTVDIAADPSGAGLGVRRVSLGSGFIGMDSRVNSILLEVEVTLSTNLTALEVIFQTELLENA
jgi:hypothetical protein